MNNFFSLRKVKMRDKTSLNIRGYGIPFAKLSPQEIEAIKKELTVEPILGFASDFGEQNRSFKVYKESRSKLYVPKHYGLSKFGLPEEISLSKGEDIDVEFMGSLRVDQQNAVDCFMKACENPLQRGGIINLSCGGGKTVIGLHAISLLKKKTMIIVHKNFLLDQWKERIHMFLPTARVGLIKAKVIDVQDKDIIIGSLQSLSMKDYEKHIFDDIGFVIVDEIHRTGTEVFSQALQKFNFMYSMGLTATLERKDGLTKVFQWSIGDIVYQNKSRADHVAIRVASFMANDEAYHKEERMFNGKPLTSRMINNICAYQPRSRYIAEIIFQEFENSNSTRCFLVLSDRKKHLQDLFGFISESMNWDDTMARANMGFYVGGMKEKELKESETKKIILATYNYVSEGCDIGHLDTLVLTTPKTNMEQIVGRILRKKKEDRINVPLVIDVYDAFSCFKNQFTKRRRYYKSKKYTFIN